MKGFVFVALLLISLGAVNSRHTMIDKLVKEYYELKMKENVVGKFNKCSFCLEIVDSGINYALNVFLNLGVAQACQVGCADIAQRFFNKSENFEQVVDVVCTLGCLAIGIKEFINIIQKIDIDPIYYCQELTLCPISKNGAAIINLLKVSPLRGAQGTTFDIEIDYTVINETGTSDIFLEIHTVDKLPLDNEFMLFQQMPNKYREIIQVDATPNPDCEEFCEEWLPGNYTIDILLCEGQCHSIHANHKIYDEKHANFTITGSNEDTKSILINI